MLSIPCTPMSRIVRPLKQTVAFVLLSIALQGLLTPCARAQYLFNEMIGNHNTMAQGMAPGYAGTPSDSTWAITQGDFNGDGRPDIAVALSVACQTVNGPANCGLIQTYLAQADGSFAISSTMNAGINVLLAVGDVNGDKIPDLLSVQLAIVNGVWVEELVSCIGNGDGTFQAPQALGTVTPLGSVTTLAVGDFNGDGKVDAAVGANNSNSLYVYIGNGDGSFTASTPISLQQPPVQVTAADMNHDGKLDLVVEEETQLSALLGNGDGTFGPELADATRPGGNAVSFAVGDMNGDGILDVVTAGNEVDVFIGNGDGTFQAPVTNDIFIGNSGLIVTGDFNGDGITDVAMEGGWTGVLVLFGNNDGTFKLPGSVYGNAGSDGYGMALATGDFNSDGKLDIATAPYNIGTGEAFSILANNGDGTFGAGGDLVVGTSPSSVVTGDFNGDGIPDLAIADISDPIRIYLGTGGGKYGTAQVLSLATLTPLQMVAGDFNRDGKIDLATLNVDGSVSILLGTGNGSFASAVNYPGLPSSQSPMQVATGDLNNDGVPDLVVLRSPDGNASVLLGNGDGSFQAAYTVTTGLNGARSMVLADVNRDGKLDLLVNDVTGFTLQELLGNGDGTFQAGISVLPQINLQGQSNPPLYSFGIADLRGSGIPDVITADASAVYVWPGSGDGTFGQPIQNYGVAGEGTHMVFGDFNGDGKSDVAMCGDADAIWLSLGNGDDTLGPQIMYNIPRTDGDYSCNAIVAGDFNGDGSLDLATLTNAYPANGSLTLLLSNSVVAFSNSSLTFPATNAGATSAGSLLNVTNQSTVPLSLNAISISGANAGDFGLTKNCGASLAGGASCQVTVTFTPSAAGTRNAIITFTDSSSGSPQNITLTGTGSQTNPVNPTITWLTPTPIFYGTALSAVQLNASANVPGTFTYAPALGTVLPAGTQTLSVTFTPTSTNYAPATATVSLSVLPAVSALSLTSSANPSSTGQAVTFTATVNLLGNATATGTVMFQDGPTILGSSALAENSATFSISTLTTGTHSITATYNGDANVFAASAFLSQTVTASMGGQTVQFQGLITTIAGNGIEGFNGDTIPATGAELADPTGVAIDRAGNLFIADAFDNRVRKVTPAGVITTVAGNGFQGYNGDSISATSANLSSPTAVAVDNSGNLYIADYLNYRVRKVTPAGVITTVAGNGIYGYSGDNIPATSAGLVPAGIATDNSGNLYIADISDNRVSKVTPAGVISTIAGNGVAGYNGDNIPATSANLNNPAGIAVDGAGNLYIADESNQRIRMVTPSGIITTIAGNGSAGYNGDNILATSASLNLPRGIAVDNAGNLYISDSLNHRIRVVTPAGVISSVAGNGNYGYNGDNIAPTGSSLWTPTDLALDSAGNIYIADQGNQRIREVQTSAVNFGSVNVGHASTTFSIGFSVSPPQPTLIGVVGNDYQSPGSTCTETSCTINVTFSPLAVGPRNGAVLIQNLRMGTLATVYLYGIGLGPQIGFGPGVNTEVAGNGNPGYSGDGGPAINADMTDPTGIITDGVGNFYLADSGNGLVRMISTNGTITTVAGTVPGGSGLVCSGTDNYGTGCPATQVPMNPQALAMDGAGNLYIAANQVYQMSPAGVLYHLAGTTGLGTCTPSSQITCPASSVQMYAEGVAVDVQGNVYVADMTGNQVYRITPAGVLSVFAGTGILGYSGDGGPAASAQLYGPSALAFDAAGNLYIADSLNNVVRMVGAGTGIISTVAGNGVVGFIGDGGPATNAELDRPTGVIIDAAGDLLIADSWNQSIRKITPDGKISTIATLSSGFMQNLVLDNNGNLYATDPASNVVRKIDYSDPPALSFPNTSVGSVSPAQDVTIENSGNAPLNLSQISVPANFSVAGADTTCATNGQLISPAAACALGIEFVPTTSANPVTGSITLTDNMPSASQSISLAGNSQSLATSISWATPQPVSYGAPLTVAQLNATANTAGTFSYSPTLGTVLPAGTQTLSVTFTPASTSYTPATTTVSLVVNPAPLTITASSTTVPYGSAAPAITASFAGFLNGDSSTSLSTQPNCTTAYTTTSPAGSSPATICSGAAATNYAITYLSGIVTVTKATPVINWISPAAINYGTPLGATQLDATFGGVAGTATYSPALGTVLGAGDQTLRVTFAPTDAMDYDAPAAATALILVNKVPLTVTAQNASKVYGGPLPALTYALAGFVNGDTSSVVSGTPAITTTATATSPVGTYPINAAIGSLGATNYSFVTANGNLTVTQAASTVSVSSSANPSSTGQTVTFAATLSPQFGGTATGTVTFKDGATILGSMAVAGNSATFSTSALAAGPHSVTASYSGDTNVQGASSAALSQTVNGSTSNATTTFLESSVNPGYIGQPITYTAVVSSTGGTPGGNITLRQGANTLAVLPLAGGVAAYTTNYTNTGSHSITAVYGGNTSFTASTSPVLTELIKSLPAATTTVLTLSSGSQSYAGQMITLMATVSTNYVPPSNGELVLFTSGGTVIGSAPLSSAVATLNISTLGVGTHTIRAVYDGNSSLAKSTSAPVSLVISRYPTTSTVISSLNPSSFGSNVVFSATVASAGLNTPTGTFTFRDGKTNLGTVALSGGTASLARTNLVAGTHAITAVYNGDALNASSTSTVLAQVVTAAPTTTAIRSSINPSRGGQSVRFTATVTSVSGTTPTGTVTFVAGTTTLGTETLAGGSASITANTIPSGTTQVTATYNGSTNMIGSSASLIQTVR